MASRTRPVPSAAQSSSSLASSGSRGNLIVGRLMRLSLITVTAVTVVLSAFRLNILIPSARAGY